MGVSPERRHMCVEVGVRVVMLRHFGELGAVEGDDGEEAVMGWDGGRWGSVSEYVDLARCFGLV